MKRVCLVACVALVALALTACGGETSTATPVAATPSAQGATATATAPVPGTPTSPAPSGTTGAPTPGATATVPSAGSSAPGTPPSAATGGPAPGRVAAAQQFVAQLADGDFTAAEDSFDDAMKKALPPDKLKSTWMQVETQAGAFLAQDATRTAQTKQGGITYDVVFVTCGFALAAVDVRVVFDPQGRISGLFFTPTPTPTPNPAMLTPPPYLTPGAVQDRGITVHSGEWALPGTVSMPAGAGPFPAVVLVHGSGPQDRDETTVANKPFRDLAAGLASRGVAVLRYDKRTYVNAAKAVAVPSFTVKDETIDDALAAVALLRQTAGVDPGRVFVLGHSLGGMMAPRIGAADPRLAGLVIMAGNTRPLEDVTIEQFTYLYSLVGTPTPAMQRYLDTLRQQVARVKDPGLSASTPASELPLRVPPSYWLDLRDYRPAEAARSLTMRLLILQGGRDYQVTPANFQGWQTALSGRSNVTFKLYPALDHLFLPGSGPSTPDEYAVAGHVDPAVIGDLAAWITAPAPP